MFSLLSRLLLTHMLQLNLSNLNFFMVFFVKTIKQIFSQALKNVCKKLVENLEIIFTTKSTSFIISFINTLNVFCQLVLWFDKAAKSGFSSGGP